MKLWSKRNKGKRVRRYCDVSELVFFSPFFRKYLFSCLQFWIELFWEESYVYLGTIQILTPGALLNCGMSYNRKYTMRRKMRTNRCGGLENDILIRILHIACCTSGTEGRTYCSFSHNAPGILSVWSWTNFHPSLHSRTASTPATDTHQTSEDYTARRFAEVEDQCRESRNPVSRIHWKICTVARWGNYCNRP